MFNQDELRYLFMCVDNYHVSNTEMARGKAHMLVRLADALDESAKPKEPEMIEDNITDLMKTGSDKK